MAKQLKSSEVLTHTQGGKRRNSTVRKHYIRWRQQQNPPIPYRCDNKECRFYTEPLIWNNKSLKLILDHITGNSNDNSPKNLRFLCPNCESQTNTHGGANKGRIEELGGGYSILRNDKINKDYRMVVNPIEIKIEGQSVELRIGNIDKEKD